MKQFLFFSMSAALALAADVDSLFQFEYTRSNHTTLVIGSNLQQIKAVPMLKMMYSFIATSNCTTTCGATKHIYDPVQTSSWSVYMDIGMELNDQATRKLTREDPQKVWMKRSIREERSSATTCAV